MAEKKPFLLRVDRTLLEQIQRWANDDLRSLNGQIEYLLRDGLRRAGRNADAGRKTDDGRERLTATADDGELRPTAAADGELLTTEDSDDAS